MIIPVRQEFGQKESAEPGICRRAYGMRRQRTGYESIRGEVTAIPPDKPPARTIIVVLLAMPGAGDRRWGRWPPVVAFLCQPYSLSCRGSAVNDRVKTFQHEERILMLPDIAAHGDAGASRFDGLLNHGQDSNFVAGSTA